MLYLGPDRAGAFIQVSIKSIECRRVAQSLVRRGQSATFAIRTLNRKITLRKNAFRRGEKDENEEDECNDEDSFLFISLPVFLSFDPAYLPTLSL